jgi:hypothetical protein
MFGLKLTCAGFHLAAASEPLSQTFSPPASKGASVLRFIRLLGRDLQNPSGYVVICVLGAIGLFMAVAFHV